MTAIRRLLAWLYDFALALFVAGWVVWDTLVLGGLLGYSSGAWADQMVSWDVALSRYGEQRGFADWLPGLLGCLPWLLELGFLLAVAALLVRLLRRFARVTPGEWAFSVRRAPSPPPAGGFVRGFLRAAGGIAAFAAVLFLWSLLDLFVLDPV